MAGTLVFSGLNAEERSSYGNVALFYFNLILKFCENFFPSILTQSKRSWKT